MKPTTSRLAGLHRMRVAGICVPVMALVGIAAVAAAVAMALNSGDDGPARVVETTTHGVQFALESRWQGTSGDWRQIGDIQAQVTEVAASLPDLRLLRFISAEKDADGHRFVFQSATGSGPVAQPLQSLSAWVESHLRDAAETGRISVEFSESGTGEFGTGFAPIRGADGVVLGFIEVQVELPPSGGRAAKGIGLGGLLILALGGGVWAWSTKAQRRPQADAPESVAAAGDEAQEGRSGTEAGLAASVGGSHGRPDQPGTETILDGLGVGVILLDGGGGIRLANRLACEILGQPAGPEAVKGHGISEICDRYPALREIVRSPGDRGGERVISGHDRSLAVTLADLFSEGSHAGLLLTLKDVTARESRENESREHSARLEVAQKALEGLSDELARANAALEQMSSADPVTGLATNRRFMEALAQEVDRSTATGRPFSLAIIDIDSFSDYNHEFGYVAGDEALRTVARVLRQSLRRSDIAARLRGGQMAALLLDTDLCAAMVLGDRLAKHLEVVSFPGENLTFNTGVVEFGRHGQDPRQLIDSAAAALEAARKTAGNSIATIPGEGEAGEQGLTRAA